MTIKSQSPSGVIVLGMSRSGTSAVAGVFRAAGFFLGADEELMEGDAHNPKGYNENLRIYTENERILQEAGGSWFAPPEPEALLARRDEIETIRSLVLEMLDDAAGAPVLVKDPRVGVLMPLWMAAVEDLLHPVLVIRDPLEIANSLERRDGTSGPVALAGWEVHMCRVLSGLKGRSVTAVRYRELVSNRDQAVQAVEAATDALDPRLKARVRAEYVQDAVDPELWRARSVNTDVGQFLTGFQQELWAFLAATPTGTHRLDLPEQLQQPTPAARNAVASESARIKTIQDRDWLQEQYDDLAAQLAHARAAHDLAVTDRDLALEARDLALAARDQLAANLEAMSNSMSWRMTKPLRDARKVLPRNRRAAD